MAFLICLCSFSGYGQVKRVDSVGAVYKITAYRGGLSASRYFQMPNISNIDTLFDSCGLIWFDSRTTKAYYHNCKDRFQLLSIDDSNLIKTWAGGGGPGRPQTLDEVLAQGNTAIDKELALLNANARVRMLPEGFVFYDSLSGTGTFTLRWGAFSKGDYEAEFQHNKSGTIAYLTDITDLAAIMYDSLAAIRADMGGGGGVGTFDQTLAAGNSSSNKDMDMFGPGVAQINFYANTVAPQIRLVSSGTTPGGVGSLRIQAGDGIGATLFQVSNNLHNHLLRWDALTADQFVNFQNGSGHIALEPLRVDFVGETAVNVTHNLGWYPLIQFIDETGAVRVPLTITHNSVNDFTVSFGMPTTGSIIYSR